MLNITSQTIAVFNGIRMALIALPLPTFYFITGNGLKAGSTKFVKIKWTVFAKEK